MIKIILSNYIFDSHVPQGSVCFGQQRGSLESFNSVHAGISPIMFHLSSDFKSDLFLCLSANVGLTGTHHILIGARQGQTTTETETLKYTNYFWGLQQFDKTFKWKQVHKWKRQCCHLVVQMS